MSEKAYNEEKALFGYKAFYKGKSIEVYAKTSYAAQVAAAKVFKAKKSWEVSVVLCEKGGEPVFHSASEF